MQKYIWKMASNSLKNPGKILEFCGCGKVGTLERDYLARIIPESIGERHRDVVGGGADLRPGYFLAKKYAKTKELDPWGEGVCQQHPLDPPMTIIKYWKLGAFLTLYSQSSTTRVRISLLLVGSTDPLGESKYGVLGIIMMQWLLGGAMVVVPWDLSCDL